MADGSSGEEWLLRLWVHSPDEQKVIDFLDIKTPSSKKECQIAGYAALIPGHNAALQPKCKIHMEL